MGASPWTLAQRLDKIDRLLGDAVEAVYAGRHLPSLPDHLLFEAWERLQLARAALLPKQLLRQRLLRTTLRPAPATVEPFTARYYDTDQARWLVWLGGRWQAEPDAPPPRTCRACAHSFMEPDGPLTCGEPNNGSAFGLRITAEPLPHCPAFLKFEQHPLRYPDGSLRRGAP